MRIVAFLEVGQVLELHPAPRADAPEGDPALLQQLDEVRPGHTQEIRGLEDLHRDLGMGPFLLTAGLDRDRALLRALAGGHELRERFRRNG